jgi:hypothetical protein
MEMINESRNIVESIVPLIEEFKNKPELELEGSLGILKPTLFQPGVDFCYFKSLYSVFQKAGEERHIWSKENPKEHFASFFFSEDIRGRYSIANKPVFIRKLPVSNCDIICKERIYDLRVNLKSEVLVSDYIATEPPIYVRLHERWTFIYKNTWKYDFSKVSSGKTKESACKSLPVFEVELELLRNNTVFLNESSTVIATNLVEKLIDLLGRFDENGDLFSYSLRVK